MPEIKTFGSHLVDFDMIPENGVFIDAGACEGNFIDDILSEAINPYIFALEPNRSNYRLIHDVYKGYTNIHAFRAALVKSGEPKTMKFADFTHVRLPEWGNVTGLYENRKPKYYNVQTMTIRELLTIIPEGPIHHLKMDIEGCEHGVVKDLTKEDAQRIQQISMEVHNGLQGMVEHLEGIGYHTKFENGELYATARG
jgi:FkbM family methyltransferase